MKYKHIKTMSHVHEYNHMKESYYGGGFIHKTLNILQSYPCSPCQSWFSSGSRPVEGFITQLQQNKKKTVRVHCFVCTLYAFVPRWNDGSKGKFNKSFGNKLWHRSSFK